MISLKRAPSPQPVCCYRMVAIWTWKSWRSTPSQTGSRSSLRCRAGIPLSRLPLCHSRKFLVGIQKTGSRTGTKSKTPLTPALSHQGRGGKNAASSSEPGRFYPCHSIPVIPDSFNRESRVLSLPVIRSRPVPPAFLSCPHPRPLPEGEGERKPPPSLSFPPALDSR